MALQIRKKGGIGVWGIISIGDFVTPIWIFGATLFTDGFSLFDLRAPNICFGRRGLIIATTHAGIGLSIGSSRASSLGIVGGVEQKVSNFSLFGNGGFILMLIITLVVLIISLPEVVNSSASAVV